VTERVGLEQQRRQAQKMEAVALLAGGVAHDFNNMLTAIFGYADLTAEELPAESPVRQDLEEIRKAAQRASELTCQLLAFSRQQLLQPMVLSLNDLVEDVEKMLGRLIGEDVELRFALNPESGNVRADPGQLRQVLMNLVVNARDAMPTGGKLLIETANAELSEQYAESHQPLVPGPYVMLAVSDTGVGMDADTKARVFEPFFTTKGKGRGMGLGLSTVYGIVKQSGGYVWVYSERGSGTTFKVYLPRVDAPAEAPAPNREAGPLTGTETILLAEDDEQLRPLTKGLLEKLGYTVLEAENAERALGVAGAHPGPIHLLVADVVMPGASGRELARQLARSRPDTRVLYVSGYTDDAIVRHGVLEPGLVFLQKPFTPTALGRKVREVLDAR
jgi:CheY-like chemotaxis protein